MVWGPGVKNGRVQRGQVKAAPKNPPKGDGGKKTTAKAKPAVKDAHQSQDKFMCRFPEGVRPRVEAEAKRLNVSMNSLVVDTVCRRLGIDATDMKGGSSVPQMQGANAAINQLVTCDGMVFVIEGFAMKGAVLVAKGTDLNSRKKVTAPVNQLSAVTLS